MTITIDSSTIAALAALVAALTGVVSLFRVHSLHLQINSRFDEFLEKEHALGKAEGVAQQTGPDL